MPEYLVETYAARDAADSVAHAARRARRATEDMTREGTAVRFVRSLFVPEDETCFFLYEAETIDVVRTAAALAELEFDRVAETVAEPVSPAPQASR